MEKRKSSEEILCCPIVAIFSIIMTLHATNSICIMINIPFALVEAKIVRETKL